MSFNKRPYNVQSYWTWFAPLTSSWDSFILDWFWIHNDNYYVIDKSDIFRTDLKGFDYPIHNGRWYISNYYRWRKIKLDLVAKAETAWEFNDILDTLRWKLAKNNVLNTMTLQ